MTRETKPLLPWNESAELRVITEPQWFCRTCGRFFGSDERQARYCCSGSRICEDCGKECHKHFTVCNSCDRIRREKKWFEKPVVSWDGEFPITLWDSDEFFFDLESLQDYIYELELDEGETLIDYVNNMRFTSCKPTKPRDFDLSSLFEDCLGDDQDPPENDELEKAVNDWVKSLIPVSYNMTGQRLDVSQVIAAIGPETLTRMQIERDLEQ